MRPEHLHLAWSGANEHPEQLLGIGPALISFDLMLQSDGDGDDTAATQTDRHDTERERLLDGEGGKKQEAQAALHACHGREMINNSNRIQIDKMGITASLHPSIGTSDTVMNEPSRTGGLVVLCCSDSPCLTIVLRILLRGFELELDEQEMGERGGDGVEG